MNLTPDTHVRIWAVGAPEQFGKEATQAFSDPGSTISTLEISRLTAVGKLVFDGRLDSWVEESLRSLEGEILEVSHEDAGRA